MSILDIGIILTFVIGVFIGVKKGFINGILSFAGIIVSLVISFLFKDYLSSFFLKSMPFFKFSGSLEGMSSLNILMYEGISFLVIFLMLIGVLRFILKITGVIQKVIDMSIIFTLPSKIIGAIVGFANSLIVAFIISFVLINLTSTHDLVESSEFIPVILNKTPILSKVSKDYVSVFDSINTLTDKCKIDVDKSVCNTDLANQLIKYEIISPSEMLYLIEKGKIYNINKEDLNILW